MHNTRNKIYFKNQKYMNTKAAKMLNLKPLPWNFERKSKL